METIIKGENGEGKDPKRGFTLIEVLISLAVFVVAFLSLIFANIYIQQRHEERTQELLALGDALKLLEQMRKVSNSGEFPGNVVQAFPEGVPLPVENSNLPAETITVDYEDPLGDPLEFTVEVTWLRKGIRSGKTQLRTGMTQRRFPVKR